MIMDQTGKRIVGEELGPLDQGQAVTLDCLVNGGESQIRTESVKDVFDVWCQARRIEL